MSVIDKPPVMDTLSVLDTLHEIDENNFINHFARNLPRSQAVVNNTHQSDSEIIDIGLPDNYLAITTDQVTEEINAGLYTDPFMIGWMAIVVNLSDLAAVGAQPTGLLLSTTLSEEWDSQFVKSIIEGMSCALQEHGCGSVGGDLNTGEPSLGATALGIVDKNKVMFRTGMNHNDLVYITAPIGMGGAYAFVRLAMADKIDQYPYRPYARIKEAKIIANYATSCMDTSDGILFALDQLYRLNNAALMIDNTTTSIHEKVHELSAATGLNPIAILAAIHGEFELCFTIPPEQEEQFLQEMVQNNHSPIKIGKVVRDDQVRPGVYVHNSLFPGGEIRNCWTRSESSEDYIKNVLEIINNFLGK